jgi:hypothetical protein
MASKYDEMKSMVPIEKHLIEDERKDILPVLHVTCL